MTRYGRSRLLYGLAFLSLLAIVPCLYQGVVLGVTAEEGLKYTVPHLPQQRLDFEAMRRSSNRWMWAAVLSFIVCSVAGLAARKERA